MTTFVERSIEVAVPVRTAYDQWTQFEEFPRFMAGVEAVTQIGDALTHWVADIAGVHREWDAAILEQVPDEKVAWAATSGATNAGAVYFTAVGEDRTNVRLTLEFEPEGIVERIGDVFDLVDRQAVADLDRFKEYIERTGEATGGWRGMVENGEVQGTSGEEPTSTGAGANLRGVAAGSGVGAVGPEDATVSDDLVASDEATADDVPGDLVAVGPTGGTRSTLDTEPGPPEVDAAEDEGPGVGHSGDPVAVAPPDAGGGRHEAAWADELGGRPGTTGAATDPVGEDWSTDADPDATAGGRGPADPVAPTPEPLGEAWSPQDSGEGAHRRVEEPDDQSSTGPTG